MDYIKSDISNLISQDDFLLSDVKPAEWAQKKRIMTTDVSNFPGPFSYDRTPYLVEVVNALMPEHPAKKIVVMKGAQIGFSTGVIENGIGYLMSENPCNILLAARDERLVKKMMNTKIDQMIDSCGLRHLLGSNVRKSKNQLTGDTSLEKIFPGGSITAFSVQTPGKMRQISAQVGFLDDFEAAPADKNAGGAAELFETRFASYFDKMKIMYISTPEEKNMSNIEPMYLAGDQRRYHVPCPKCGEYIILEWSTIGADGKPAGIIYEYDDEGDLVDGSVRYKCQCCGSEFTDGHKYDMNLAGEWRPTAIQKDPTYFSYQISALYAPPGMYDWEYYAKMRLKALPPNGRPNIDTLKVFLNTCLGVTFEERGTRLKVNTLSKNTRPYPVGIVPNEMSMDEGNGQIVMLTCAADLNGTIEDARLDWEIVAWAESGVSYSIDHGSIGTFIPRENTIKNKVDRERWTYEAFGRSVWPEFMKILQSEFESDSGDRSFKISINGLDTGHFTKYAYNFIEAANANNIFTVGLKGLSEDRYRRMDANTSIFSKSKERSDLMLIQVNMIKDELAGCVNLKWNEEDDILQPNGFLNFPTPSNEKYTMKSYFSHYESEQKKLKTDPSGKEVGYLWEKVNSNVMNHHWDVMVYNRAVKEILMYMICQAYGDKEPNWKSYCAYITG